MTRYFFIVDGFKVGEVMFEPMTQQQRRAIKKDFACKLGINWGEVELI